MQEDAPDRRTGPAAEGNISAPGFATDRGMAWVFAACGVVGFLASGQLVLERLALYEDPNYVTSCDISPFVSCGEVFRTWQAALFGFPNPLIGIVAFAVILTTAMVLFSGARPARWYWRGLQAGVTLGFVFIVWLWSQALFAIHILCLYCMAVWAVMIVLTVLLTARNAIHGDLPVPSVVRRFLAEWAWPLSVLLLVAAAASVFFSFSRAFLG
ncbi:vitamin K epoxide reductase family protein [uncultured Arthrobacter sp.]|uniref:vitamin K epoxide reductase family protein n=1 Tax=uncultured Arthrobacter sp. TaxID=114050 RepID=UPI00262D017F|nr:vitamin K epoxide reductase family protein [uncultured Arthrobacter sp.]